MAEVEENAENLGFVNLDDIANDDYEALLLHVLVPAVERGIMGYPFVANLFSLPPQTILDVDPPEIIRRFTILQRYPANDILSGKYVRAQYAMGRRVVLGQYRQERSIRVTNGGIVGRKTTFGYRHVTNGQKMNTDYKLDQLQIQGEDLVLCLLRNFKMAGDLDPHPEGGDSDSGDSDSDSGDSDSDSGDSDYEGDEADDDSESDSEDDEEAEGNSREEEEEFFLGGLFAGEEVAQGVSDSGVEAAEMFAGKMTEDLDPHSGGGDSYSEGGEDSYSESGDAGSESEYDEEAVGGVFAEELAKEEAGVGSAGLSKPKNESAQIG